MAMRFEDNDTRGWVMSAVSGAGEFLSRLELGEMIDSLLTIMP
jgi:hypothetical protein